MSDSEAAEKKFLQELEEELSAIRRRAGEIIKRVQKESRALWPDLFDPKKGGDRRGPVKDKDSS